MNVYVTITAFEMQWKSKHLLLFEHNYTNTKLNTLLPFSCNKMHYLIPERWVGLNSGRIERKRHSKDINNVFVIVFSSIFNYMQKYFHMEKAYELQVKQGVSCVSQNKEYGPIIPYLTAGIELWVAFIKFDIDPRCCWKLGNLFCR